MVAVSVVAIGIAGASRLMVSTMMLSGIAKDRNTAVSLARSRFEQLSMSALGDLGAWSVTNQVVNAMGQPDPEGGFRLTTLVSYPQTNLAEIAIVVHVRDRVTQRFDGEPERINTYLSSTQ